MKFRYARYGSILRPVIPIKIVNGASRISCQVLVDSGADLCLFDEELGEAVGLKVRRGKPNEVFGVGGKASIYYIHDVVIEVGGWPFKIKAGFMPSVGGRVAPYSIVGQAGFFEHFKVVFDLAKEEIELKRKEVTK